MKKTSTYLLAWLILSFISFKASAQIFIFPDTSTEVGCYDGSSYTLHSGVKITGVKVVQVYYDDGTTTGTSNSFSYEIQFSYGNIFDGVVNSTGNFYTYTVTMYTQNALAGGTITNNGSNIPLVTDTVGNMNLHNNPTYNYSASQLGLQAGVTYTGADTIGIFGYDSVTLNASAPCLTVNAGANANVNAPLSISLANFTAAINNGKVSLAWNTRMEANNAGFMVQKSTDGKSWSDLVWIASMAQGGNSIAPLNYITTDPDPAGGTNFYRLMQTDINHHKTLSKVAMVVNNLSGSNVLVYPNPSANTIHINSKTALLKTPYSLTNITGQIVKKDVLSGNDAEINVADVANGVYMLQLGSSKQKVTIVH